jgi:hypothetical protein
MESFFLVIIWIASLNSKNKAHFERKLLAVIRDYESSPIDIAYEKDIWFGKKERFHARITMLFEPLYRKDNRFIACISKLREILYAEDRPRSDTEIADPIEEGLFRMCIKEIDDYLYEKRGKR